MSLVNLLDEIREDLRQMESITRVYGGVPDSVNEFPAVIVAAMEGRCWLASHDSTMHCENDIRVEIHVPRKDLENDAAKMTAIADEAAYYIYRGFVTDRYNGTMIVTGNPQVANNATSPLSYTIGPSEWAGQQTYAMLCDFKVTTERTLQP